MIMKTNIRKETYLGFFFYIFIYLWCRDIFGVKGRSPCEIPFGSAKSSIELPLLTKLDKLIYKEDKTMATIATHLGGGKAHQAHNFRDSRCVEKEPHIDPNGHHETWVHEPVKEAYHRLFDEAQQKYNDKQTREDRQIEDYYTKIMHDKVKHTAYETIYGVYGNNDKQTEKEIYQEIVRTWNERNPNLVLIGAYYHDDEKGGHHLHCDWIPVVHDCTRGMEVQTGLNGALKEMGFYTSGTSRTAQMFWEKAENQYLERLCRDRGIEIEHPMSKDVTRERAEHLDTLEYKVAQKERELNDRIISFNDKADYINKHYQELDRAEAYCDKIERYCYKTGQSINDYYVHEFWADRGIREHQYPEIYNPSRTEQEREEIREHFEQDREQDREQDKDRDRGER